MCTSVSFEGNSGAINVHMDPNGSGTLSWTVVMYNPDFRGGAWTYREFVGAKIRQGEVGKVRDILHNSLPAEFATPGKVFSLVVTYVDPFGFTHTNVPNGCIIP